MVASTSAYVPTSLDSTTLSILDRARLLAELQRGRTGGDDEHRIAELIVGTRGADLWHLKRLHDAASSYRDLVQLVYRDIDDASIRTRLLAHFRDEAALLTPDARRRKIVSDVDDTIWCNWKDARYPKKAVYPGALAFYEALCPPASDDHPHADITFLTARPRDRMGLVERLTHRTLRKLGIRGASVLSGALHKVLSNRGIAEGKLDNLLRYREVYPECDFILVGDSGQGDVELAVAALERAGEAVRAVFIHDVVHTPEDTRARYRERGIVFFDTYVGAAAVAAELGLISSGEALRIARRASKELAALELSAQAVAGHLVELFERDAALVARAGVDET
jgi:hypothetical protein